MPAAHPLIPGEHVGSDVAKRMADVQPDAARVGEHVEHVAGGTASHLLEARRERTDRIGRSERPFVRPAALPPGLDLASQSRVIPEGIVAAVHFLASGTCSGNKKTPRAGGGAASRYGSARLGGKEASATEHVCTIAFASSLPA